MNIKMIILQWHIQSVIIMSLAFMWLMPYGTFDPTKLGFYISILCAATIEIILAELFKFPRADK